MPDVESKAEIFSSPDLAKDVVRVSQPNPWALKKRQKILLQDGNAFHQFAAVELIAGQVAAGDQNHIHSSKWTGVNGKEISLRRISAVGYMWKVAASSPKLKVGLLLTVCAIASAYFSAAITKEGDIHFQLGLWKWLLFGVTVASALGSWAKDLL